MNNQNIHPNHNSNSNSYIKYLKYGLFAGIAATTSILTYPLEVLKIRNQVIENKIKNKILMTNMIKEEGLRSFYKGLSQNLVVGFIGYGSVFFFHELFTNYLNHNSNLNKKVISILSSTSAGIIAVVLASPFNFVKTRQILYKGKNTVNNDIKTKSQSMIYIIKDIYKEKGSLIGFWKALNPSILTSFYSAIQISCYDILKQKFINEKNSQNLNLNSLLGLISRSIAATFIYPFALLRSRMLNFDKSFMSKELNQNEIFYNSDNKYSIIFKDLYLIIKREGVRSLFKGLQFELVKVSINGALFFYTYEWLKKNYL